MDLKPQSEFSGDLNYLNRINILFYQVDQSALALDAYTWFHTLMVLYRELSTEMSDEDLKKAKEDTQKLAKELASWNNRKNKGYNEIRQEFYNQLHEFELFLRRVHKEAGLQMKMREDPTRALRA